MGGAQPARLVTFLILWWMHESARLNVFLGVRNVSEEFLPDHLSYLKSFLRKKPMNALFPFSVTISTLVNAWLIYMAWTAATPFETAFYSFLSALMALAVLEHWFLMLPLPFEKLWSWGLTSRKRAPIAVAETQSAPATKNTRGAFIQSRADLTGLDLQQKKGQRVGACDA